MFADSIQAHSPTVDSKLVGPISAVHPPGTSLGNGSAAWNEVTREASASYQCGLSPIWGLRRLCVASDPFYVYG